MSILGLFFLEEAEKRLLDERLLNTIVILLTSFLWFDFGVLVSILQVSTVHICYLFQYLQVVKRKHPAFSSPPPRRQHVKRLISRCLVIIEQLLHLVLILIPIRISNNLADKMVDAPESPQPQQQSV